MLDAVNLKTYMIKSLRTSVILFYIVQFFRHAAVPFIDDPFIYHTAKTVPHVLEVLILGFIMFTFRSRHWPQFFAIGINEMPVGGEGGDSSEHQLFIAPILEALIYDRQINGKGDGSSRSGSLNSKQQIVIMITALYQSLFTLSQQTATLLELLLCHSLQSERQ